MATAAPTMEWTHPEAGDALLYRIWLYLYSRRDYNAARFIREFVHRRSMRLQLAADIAAAREAEALDEISAIEQRRYERMTDEQLYKTHNVTRTIRSEGLVSTPNEPEMQCACDRCNRWRKANAVTGVARPGKEI